MNKKQVFRTYYYQVENDSGVYKFTASRKIEKAKALLPPTAVVLYIEPLKDQFEILWKRETL